MPFRPRRPCPTPADQRATPPEDATTAGTGHSEGPEGPLEIMRAASPATHTSADSATVAHVALRRALLDMSATSHGVEPGAREAAVFPDAADVALPFEVAPDRWADASDRLGPLALGGRRAKAADREVWANRERVRDRLADAAGAYARALRREGASLPATLLTLHVVVNEATSGRVPRGLYAAVQRAAARCCLEAFYAH